MCYCKIVLCCLSLPLQGRRIWTFPSQFVTGTFETFFVGKVLKSFWGHKGLIFISCFLKLLFLWQPYLTEGHSRMFSGILSGKKSVTGCWIVGMLRKMRVNSALRGLIIGYLKICIAQFMTKNSIKLFISWDWAFRSLAALY